MFTGCTLYARPSSSSMTETFRPFGVLHVYKSIIASRFARNDRFITNRGKPRFSSETSFPLGSLAFASYPRATGPAFQVLRNPFPRGSLEVALCPRVNRAQHESRRAWLHSRPS